MLSVAGLAQESGVLAAPKGLFSGTTGDILLVAIFQKKRISLVYLQAFREYIIVVSATTHFTTCLRKLRKRDFCLPFQECLVKVAIAFAGDIRSLETF